MATREELQAHEAECSDAAAYAALAQKALEQPADPEYAKKLLEQGEMSCSFPADYLRIAEVTLAAGDRDKAVELYAEAEGMCFEGKEKAEVGYSLALHMDDKENGRRLLEEAISSTTDKAELLAYAGYIKQALDDQALEKSLFDKVTGGCKSLDDYKELAASIIEKGDSDTARLLYQKAAVLNDGVEDIPAYAAGMLELFGDKPWVEETLSSAEGDCMFPGQFVALARGYQQLLDNKEKAEALLEQGKEFAMSGQENLDLANGYAELLGDQETAKGLYQQALGDFTTKDDLLALAGDVARRMADKTLAIAAYDKVEEKLGSAADFMLLAQAVNDDLGDKDKVAQIYARSEAKLDSPAELVALAAEVRKNLNDSDSIHTIYRKALNNSKSYTDVAKLMDDFAKDSADAGLVDQVLGKALELAEETVQMIDSAKRSSQLSSDDKSRLKQALDKAEDNVGSLDEMRKLSSAVKQYAADDEERLQRVTGKLEKREQSQVRYLEFQKQEKTFTRPAQFIQLAHAVVDELDDVSYATQLLGTAEEKMRQSPYSLANFLPLIVAVDHLTKDRNWTERLLDEAAGHCHQLPAVKALGETAAKGLADGDFGKQWLGKFYPSYLEQLKSSNAGAFEFLKMARAIREHLEDSDLTEQSLNAAAEHAESHFHYAYIADQVSRWGDPDRADALYEKAAAVCTDGKALKELVQVMRNAGVAEDRQRAIYSNGDAIADTWKKLRWVEGIMGLFGDNEWAKSAYEKLQSSFTEEESRRLFQRSRDSQLNKQKFY